MKVLFRSIAKKIPFYYPLHNWLKRRRQVKEIRKEILQWEMKGKPVPPPHIIKQRTLEAYGKRFGLKVLLETGTYRGDMVEAMKKTFQRIYSIEQGTI